MDAEAVDRKLEVMSGHIEALRVMVIAAAILAPNKEELLRLYRELLDSQRERLQCQPVSDEFLDGLNLAGESLLELISPSRS